MTNLTCVPCQTKYTIKKQGVLLVTTFGENQPYKIYEGDVWICPNCSHELIAGVASHPIAEHYQQPRFDEILRKAQEAGTPIIYQYERNLGAARYQAGPEEGEICPKT